MQIIFFSSDFLSKSGQNITVHFYFAKPLTISLYLFLCWLLKQITHKLHKRPREIKSHIAERDYNIGSKNKLREFGESRTYIRKLGESKAIFRLNGAEEAKRHNKFKATQKMTTTAFAKTVLRLPSDTLPHETLRPKWSHF